MSRPALVMVHGWGMHGGVWADIAAGLRDRLDVYRPDLPGHGNAAWTAPSSVEQLVDELAAAAPARCTVAGWSLGGQLALLWARRHPAQVERLVLVATPPKFVQAPDWPHGLAAVVVDEFTAALMQDAAAVLRRFLRLQAQGDAQARAVVRRLESTLAEHPVPERTVLEQTLDWLRINDLRALLPAIRQPALVLYGKRDGIVSPAAADYLATHLPRARAQGFADAAHAPFISDPATVCRLLADFCDG